MKKIIFFSLPHLPQLLCYSVFHHLKFETDIHIQNVFFFLDWLQFEVSFDNKSAKKLYLCVHWRLQFVSRLLLQLGFEGAIFIHSIDWVFFMNLAAIQVKVWIRYVNDDWMNVIKWTDNNRCLSSLDQFAFDTTF